MGRRPRTGPIDISAERPEIESFFEGVDEMRKHLDRHLHDPDRHRERLGRIARDLLRPRSTRGLVVWWGRALRAALGAERVAVWLGDESTQRLWFAEGSGPPLAPPIELEGSDSRLLLVVPGSTATVAWLLIDGMPVLDPETGRLLEAISGTAGMALEQSLKVEALGQETDTGALSEATFQEQAGPELRHLPVARHLHVILALRVFEVPAERQRTRALIEAFPPGAPHHVRNLEGASAPGFELFTVVGDVPAEGADADARDWLADAGRRSGRRWCGAYQTLSEPIDDLASLIDEVVALLDAAGPAEIRARADLNVTSET